MGDVSEWDGRECSPRRDRWRRRREDRLGDGWYLMRPLASGVRSMRGIILSVAIALLIIVGQPVGASIVPLPGTTIPCDFVTGGGFIVGSGSPESSLAAGAKANFAVGGG